MADAAEVPWVKLAGVAGGVMALAVVVRDTSALARVARGEVHYRAGDPDAWLKWLR